MKQGNDSRRATILIKARDLAGAFLYYDRKECEELPRGIIEGVINDGDVSVDEIVAAFRDGLTEDGGLQ